MLQSNLGGREESKGIKRIQATNHVKFTMSGINQNLLSMQRNRKIQPIMRRKINQSKLMQMLELVDKNGKTVIITISDVPKVK